MLKTENICLNDNIAKKNINKLGTPLNAAPLRREVNVKNKPDFIGSKVLAKAIGKPGDTVSISRTQGVTRTYSVSGSIGDKTSWANTISAAVGYNVAKSDNISISGNRKVPSKVGGKKVKEMHYKAYAIYEVKSYDIQINKGKKWEKCGSGTAMRAYGIKFEHDYIYK